jgi:hypothetical protein
MVLALDHHRNPPLVFPPAGRGVLADFPSAGVHPYSPTENAFIAKGLVRVVAGARDGAAADHSPFALRIAAQTFGITSPRCSTSDSR